MEEFPQGEGECANQVGSLANSLLLLHLSNCRGMGARARGKRTKYSGEDTCVCVMRRGGGWSG